MVAKSEMRYAVYALLVLLYVLHTDVWYWSDPRIVLGLPIGVTYHVLWTLVVSVAFGLAVRYAWPEELEALGPTAGSDRVSPSRGAAESGADTPGARRPETPSEP